MYLYKGCTHVNHITEDTFICFVALTSPYLRVSVHNVNAKFTHIRWQFVLQKYFTIHLNDCRIKIDTFYDEHTRARQRNAEREIERKMRLIYLCFVHIANSLSVDAVEDKTIHPVYSDEWIWRDNRNNTEYTYIYSTSTVCDAKIVHSSQNDISLCVMRFVPSTVDWCIEISKIICRFIFFFSHFRPIVAASVPKRNATVKKSHIFTQRIDRYAGIVTE